MFLNALSFGLGTFGGLLANTGSDCRFSMKSNRMLSDFCFKIKKSVHNVY